MPNIETQRPPYSLLLPPPPPPSLSLPLARDSLPSSARKFEDLDGLEPSAVPVEGRQHRKGHAAHRVQHGVAIRLHHLCPEESGRLKPVGDAEGLADGAPDAPIPHPPYLKNDPPLGNRSADFYHKVKQSKNKNGKRKRINDLNGRVHVVPRAAFVCDYESEGVPLAVVVPYQNVCFDDSNSIRSTSVAPTKRDASTVCLCHTHTSAYSTVCTTLLCARSSNKPVHTRMSTISQE